VTPAPRRSDRLWRLLCSDVNIIDEERCTFLHITLVQAIDEEHQCDALRVRLGAETTNVALPLRRRKHTYPLDTPVAADTIGLESPRLNRDVPLEAVAREIKREIVSRIWLDRDTVWCCIAIGFADC
jgi:hypothetical protein